MPSHNMELREPPLSIEFKDLEPGDILLFRPSIRIWPIQNLIILLQGLPSNDIHGHYDTTHVGIFVGLDHEGYPLMAHINDKGWAIQSLGPREEDYDSDERAFLVFRHKDEQGRKSIYQHAINETNQNCEWKLISAIGAFLRAASLDPNREVDPMTYKTISNLTFCSKFVAECIKQAARDLQQRENFLSTVTPKTLESKLYLNRNYHMLLYPGKKLYDTLKNRIQNEVNQIENKKIAIMLQTLTTYIESPEIHLPETIKAICLLKVMLPALKIYKRDKEISALARKRGIFSREYNNYPMENVINLMNKTSSLHKPLMFIDKNRRKLAMS